MNDDVFENNHERFEDVKKRGSKGDGVCLGIDGCCLFHGIFEEKDQEKGCELVKLSSEKGN